MLVCFYCQSEVPAGARVCPKCGRSLATPQRSSPAQDRTLTDVLFLLDGLSREGVLSFREDEDAGMVFIRGDHVMDGGAWVRLQEARGQVVVPEDAEVKLAMPSDTADADLGRLSTLRANDLQALDLSHTQVEGPGLALLAGLTGLQTLDLWHARVTDAGLAFLAHAPQLEELVLWDTAVSNAGLAAIKALTKLRVLDLSETRVTDAGLRKLTPLKQLEELRLWRTGVTDAGLKHLAKLEALRVLDLRRTAVSDAGLKRLAKLPALQHVDVTDTQVTRVGAATLKQHAPRCTVRW